MPTFYAELSAKDITLPPDIVKELISTGFVDPDFAEAVTLTAQAEVEANSPDLITVDYIKPAGLVWDFEGYDMPAGYRPQQFKIDWVR